MKTKRTLTIAVGLVALAATATLGQQEQLPNRQPAGATVTAVAAADHVRFTAPGNVTSMRLEVYGEAGDKLFDSRARDGNVFDWSWQSGQQQTLPDGTYLCVVTVQNLSGKVTRKLATIALENQRASLQPVETAQLTLAQAQALNPPEGGATIDSTPLTILAAAEAVAATTIAHDGAGGQLSRARGPLSFRLGDFFSGKDEEQMRLTEEGNLGIGTAKPKFKLDVAGAIRAREGLVFNDGSTLNVNDKGVLTRTAPDGSVTPNISGTGTQGQLAKWTDNSGTLGDSAVTESNGRVGIGVSNPGDLLDISGPPNASSRSGIHVTTTSSTGNATLYFDNDLGNFSAYGGVLTGGSSNFNMFFGQTRLNRTFLIADGPSSLGLGVGTLVAQPLIFGTSNAERMRIESAGNVGVGTSNPGARLDVAGNINTSTQYNIANSRVLGVTGVFSTFVGIGAGSSNLPISGADNTFLGNNAGNHNFTGDSNTFVGSGSAVTNTTGRYNTMIGKFAGFFNDTGECNSFFGAPAGDTNTIGSYNTIIGAFADVGSNNLDYATAIGAYAKVNTSNTIALGRTDGSDTVLVYGKLQIDTMAAAGSTDLCLNGSNRVGTCSSSLRYKTNLAPYLHGLSIINRLRPITFTWKDSKLRDLGFGAEDVEKIDPLLVNYNKEGQVEGVKYNRINVVLVNAIKEQQQQISGQQAQIQSLQEQLKQQQQLNQKYQQQQDQVESLKKLVCATNPTADQCRN